MINNNRNTHYLLLVIENALELESEFEHYQDWKSKALEIRIYENNQRRTQQDCPFTSEIEIKKCW